MKHRLVSILILVLLVCSPAFAQVGARGYSAQLDSSLECHLVSVDSALRTQRLSAGGLSALAAVGFGIFGGLVVADPVLQEVGYFCLAAGAGFGVSSVVMFTVPWRNERQIDRYMEMPRTSEAARVERFVAGEQALGDVADRSRTSRIIGGVANIAGGAAQCWFTTWLIGGAQVGAGVALLAIPGRFEREWEEYRGEAM